MPSFTSDGLAIAYDDMAPPGEPERTVMLVHGFASNRKEGWRRTGWYQALERRRMRTVALDLRGHGESAKPHEPDAYGRAKLAGDVLALIDRLGLGPVSIFGYSMGARVALEAALTDPGRFDRLILGGVGETLLAERPDGAGEAMAAAMLADDAEAIPEPFLRSFRHFADEQGEDRQALAAFTRHRSPAFDREALGALMLPVLVVAGTGDRGSGDPAGLAAAFPYGQSASLPGCDHFSATPHGLLKATVFDFLDGLLEP